MWIQNRSCYTNSALHTKGVLMQLSDEEQYSSKCRSSFVISMLYAQTHTAK